ncbi:MAG: PHB depolymerase family esterase [Actinomycetota bacterium]|nr:PHB depolymerase family esterase [Actinomycetota bacterium]
MFRRHDVWVKDRRHRSLLRRAGLLLLAPLAAVLPACGSAAPLRGDADGYTIDQHLRTPDGRDRLYHLHVPSDLPAGPVPLLIALHGGMGSGVQFEENSGFDAIAEREGFLVVYPDGVGVGLQENRLRTWNAGYCCGPSARDGIDDVTFIAMVINAVAADHDIDPDRVFAAGHSNGGIMAYRLACELSGRIAAVGLQAGSLGIDDCAPEQPVSLLHLHGSADTNHPIDGGPGAGVAGVDFRSARTSVRDYAQLVGCPADPQHSVDAANSDIEIETWQPCDTDTEVRFVEVQGAPHAWMGHPTQTPRLVGHPYMELDASELIVEFLLAHPRT